jgi:hypothetical protein
MDICKLCKIKKADKKGSHLVPHFLLKLIENIDGKLDRDYEIGFLINELDAKPHFGRSVSPEKLEDVFGELSEEELNENKHPLVVDYYFCTVCENRFSTVESIYADSLKNYDDKEYRSGIPCELGILFWGSVIWRMSLGESMNVQLTKNQIEKLRRILDTYLNLNPKEIDFEQMRSNKNIRKISYKLLRAPNFYKTHPTHLAVNLKMRNPYSIVFGEFFLFFSFNSNYNDFLQNSFFNIKELVFDAPENTINNEEIIYSLKEDVLLQFNSDFVDYAVNLRKKSLGSLWDKLLVKMGGKGENMPSAIKEEIFNELYADRLKLGKQHSRQELLETTVRVVSRHVKK